MFLSTSGDMETVGSLFVKLYGVQRCCRCSQKCIARFDAMKYKIRRLRLAMVADVFLQGQACFNSKPKSSEPRSAQK